MHVPPAEAAVAKTHLCTCAVNVVSKHGAGPRTAPHCQGRHGPAAGQAEIAAGHLGDPVVKAIIADEAHGSVVLHLKQPSGKAMVSGDGKQTETLKASTEGQGKELCRHQGHTDIARHLAESQSGAKAQLPTTALAPAPAELGHAFGHPNPYELL